MDTAITADLRAAALHPFKDTAALQAFEDVMRDWMKAWRDQGRVLEPDSPLRKYWPSDEPVR